VTKENLLDLLIDAYSKQQELSKIISNDSIVQAIHEDYKSNSEIKAWIAKALAFDDDNKKAVDFLCELAKDEDEDVRVEAIDSLSAFKTRKSFCILCEAICDHDDLVRSYAAFGVASVGNSVSAREAINILQKAEAREQSKRVFVDIYGGLYLLGDPTALDKLFLLFEEDDYLVQCAVLHCLGEMLSKKNQDIISSFLDHLDASQYPFAVADTLLHLKKKAAVE